MKKIELLKWKNKIIAFDLDLTLTLDSVENYLDLSPKEQEKLFRHLKPNKEMIDLLNELSKDNTVFVFTARNDCLQRVTNDWLKKHNVKCDYFLVGKPGYDLLIDDKVIRPNEIY